MTQLSDNIFSATGGLRPDLENVVVPPERRPVLNALIQAVQDEKAAEADVAAKAEAEAAAVKNRDSAAAALPKRTFMDEWKSAKGSR